MCAPFFYGTAFSSFNFSFYVPWSSMKYMLYVAECLMKKCLFVIDNILPMFKNCLCDYRKLAVDEKKLSDDVDGLGAWREAEGRRLTDLVQRRIKHVQVGRAV